MPNDIDTNATNWLDRFHSGGQTIRAVSYELERLAATMYEAGNDRIASRLAQLASHLWEAHKEQDAAIGEMLTGEVKRGDELHASILRGVIAGIEVAERSQR